LICTVDAVKLFEKIPWYLKFLDHWNNCVPVKNGSGSATPETAFRK
jgi:hypothetical protein